MYSENATNFPFAIWIILLFQFFFKREMIHDLEVITEQMLEFQFGQAVDLNACANRTLCDVQLASPIWQNASQGNKTIYSFFG